MCERPLSSAIYFIGNVPSVTKTTTAPALTEVGVPFEVAVVVSNGTPPYAFQYGNLPAGCASQSVSHLECLPTAPGTFPISVEVVDSHGYATEGTARVTVSPRLAPATLTVSPESAGVGTNRTIGVFTSGGVIPYQYAFAGLPIGCTTADSSSITCQPMQPGEYLISATVTDALAVSRTTSALLEVVPNLDLALALVGPATVVVGGTTAVVAEASGGVLPYRYQFAGLPAGCVGGSNGSVQLCSPRTPGVYIVSATVFDARNASAQASTALTVEVAPWSISAFFADPSVVFLGGSTRLTVVQSNPAINATLSYSGLPAGCLSSNTSSLRCTPGSSGNFSLVVTAALPSGGTVFATTNLTVLPYLARISSAQPVFALLDVEIGLLLPLAAGLGAGAAVWFVRFRDNAGKKES